MRDPKHFLDEWHDISAINMSLTTDDPSRMNGAHVQNTINVLTKNLSTAELANLTVLDYGSGTGRLSVFFAPRCKELICADISQKFLDSTKKTLSKYSNVRFNLLNAESPIIDANDNEIDFTFSYASLSYSTKENFWAAVHEIDRVSKNFCVQINIEPNEDDGLIIADTIEGVNIHQVCGYRPKSSTILEKFPKGNYSIENLAPEIRGNDRFFYKRSELLRVNSLNLASGTEMPRQKPTLTFFHTDGCEWQTVSPIADEAERRGYSIRFSTDLAEHVQVGVYCQHACKPNADLSVIMLHDLAQRHDIWPSFWHHEPWDAFDIGLVPGQAWVQRWKSQVGQPGTCPKHGVFDVGWPKADLICRDEPAFRREVNELRKTLGLKHPQTVLYAPSWENNGKQDDFVQMLKTLPVNLLLKQAPWSDAYPGVLESIRQMNALHEGMGDNIHVLDPNMCIMYCIGIADLLVSDESSVLIEAALFGVPSLSVQDWLIPDCSPPRLACVPFENVSKTTRSSLRQAVEEILAVPTESRAQAVRLRNHHFSHLGQSSKLAFDLIEAAWDGKELPLAPLDTPQDVIDFERYQQAEKKLLAGDTIGATVILATLITKNSNCWQAFNDMAVLCFQQGDTAGALSLFAKAIEKEERPGLACQNLADVQRVAGYIEAAVINYAKLVNTEPDNEVFRNTTAEILASNPNLSQDTYKELLRTLCPPRQS